MTARMRMARAVLRPRVSEKTEQQHIVQLLRTLGAQVYVMGTVRRRGDYAGTMQTPGIPDVMAFLPAKNSPEELGRSARMFLFVEVKARGGRLRPEQVDFQKQCLLANVVHITGGLDAVIAWLVAHGQLKADSVAHYRVPGPHV